LNIALELSSIFLGFCNTVGVKPKEKNKKAARASWTQQKNPTKKARQTKKNLSKHKMRSDQNCKKKNSRQKNKNKQK
jgi:hypothetical protein